MGRRAQTALLTSSIAEGLQESFTFCLRSVWPFADFAGNQQYLSLRNLEANPKAFIFLIDYPAWRRIKIKGQARAVTDQPDFARGLLKKGYRAAIERAIVFDVEAWDENCASHIKPRYSQSQAESKIEALRQRIAELEQAIDPVQRQSN